MANKVTGRASSVQGGLGAGAAVSMAITLAGTGVLAWLLEREHLTWEQVGYGIMVMLFAASFAGAAVAAGKIRRQKWMICALAGVVYFGLLLCITALFFGGQYSGVGATALMVLAGCGCAGLMGPGQGSGGSSRKGRRKRKKYNVR